MIRITTNSESETFELGAALGRIIKARGLNHAFTSLSGDLGAGKTVFTKGFASVISPGSRVKSPSYTIVNEYLRGDIPLYHFDFYRIADPEELYGIGFEDYLEGGICIGEWCEKVTSELPEEMIKVNIFKTGDASREITIEFPETEAYKDVDIRL